MPTPARLLLCTCAGSQSVDAASAAAATGAEARVCKALCTDEIAVAEAALSGEGTTLIACGQQARQFEELAAELGVAAPLTVDIRDRAGWTDARSAHAKQAALLATSVMPTPPTPVTTLVSQGVCLVLGGAVALEAAQILGDELAVTVLLDRAADDIVPTDAFDIAKGRIRTATGALSTFSLKVDGYAPIEPAGRGAARFAEPVDGVASQCDLIVDLRGEPPLFSAAHKRDGYLRADPRDPAAVERIVREALTLKGEFEKPLHIRFEASLCAHSRASQTGCTRCLSVCPTGAITPNGETVAIDPNVCAGCGACAAVCPSGAASLDDPPVTHLFAVLARLADAYRAAGGKTPRVLFHDAAFGGELIALSARFGRGLPADLIPVAVENVESIGHAEMLAAFGVGFSDALVLMSPRTDQEVPQREAALAAAILAGTGARNTVRVIEPAEPDALEEAVRETTPAEATSDPILPLGGRREVTRLAASALCEGRVPEPFALPAGAPYGSIDLNADACTLCLACVSLCPTGALADMADKPAVRFQETACIQCGICETVCPESAITLDPRLDLSNEAMTHRVLHEEEPFECISCGKPFGVKSTITRIVEKLEGKHWMFKGSDNVRLIQMCDDCRIGAQYHSQTSPLRMGERPRVRTTEDDLNDRKKLN